MSAPKVLGLALALAALAATPSVAQVPSPPDEDIQAHIQRILRERPVEAEAAARACLHLVARERVVNLDSLKVAAPDAYWMEVAHLAAQFQIIQHMSRRDTLRTGLLVQMFGTEAHARDLQRRYRAASTAERRAIEARLHELITRHFEAEDNMRSLELLEIRRRLQEIQSELARRQEKRAELVRWTVEGIVRDATRPR